MPFLIPALLTYAGYQTAAFIATVVISAVQNRNARSERRRLEAAGRAAYNASLQDRTTVLRTAVAPRNMVLGYDKVGGPMWPWFTYGDKRQYHQFGVTLAGHECDAVEQYFFNEDALTLDAQGWVIAPLKYSRVRQQAVNGQVIGGPFAPDASVNLGVNVTRIVVAVAYDPNAQNQETGEVVGANVIVQAALASGGVVTFPNGAPGAVTLNYEYEVVEPLFRISTYLGAPGQTAAQELIDAAAAAGTPTAWDGTRRGTSVCYCTVFMEADFNVLGQIGVPNVSARVRGVKALDTRTGVRAFTINPAMLARWYLVDSPYSPKTLSTEVGSSELVASANVCDEVIAFSAGVNAARYGLGGTLTCDATPIDNLNHILDAMDGDAVWVGGQWQIVAGYYKEPGLKLDESALSGADITIVPSPSRRDTFNAITGTYIGPAGLYQPTSYAMVTSPEYQADDGGELLVQDMPFALVPDPVRCQMIAWQRLQRARSARTVQIGFNLKGYDAWPLQNVQLDLAEFGFEAQVFQVRKRELNPPTLTYLLQETGPSLWAWDYANAQATTDIPNTSLPDTISMPRLAITGMTSGDDELVQGADGSITSRIRVAWAASGNTYVENGGTVHLQYAQANVPDAPWVQVPSIAGNQVQGWISPVNDGQFYLVRGRFVNNAGREGLWSEAQVHQVVGKTAPPANYNVFTITFQGDGTRQFEFAYTTTPAPFDLAGPVIRYIEGFVAAPDWAAMKKLNSETFPYPSSPYETNLLLSGDHTFALRAVDTSGTLAAVPLVIQATLPDRRLGGVVAEYAEHSEGWAGTKTGCRVAEGKLEALDTTTWATLPATWAAWTRWNVTPTSPITYQTPVRDFGSIVTGAINSSVNALGTVLVELRTSNTGAPAGAYGSIVGNFTGRYLQLRLTVTATGPAPVPTVTSWSWQVQGEPVEEYINNLDITTLTGGNRIGVGDIRIPLTKTYTSIKRVTVAIQSGVATPWTWHLVDKTLTGPRVQFRANGVLTDPALVDFYVEGI